MSKIRSEADRRALFKHHMPLAFSFAKNIRRGRINYVDRCQLAQEALWRALQKWDPDKGPLSPYFKKYYLGALKKHLSENAGPRTVTFIDAAKDAASQDKAPAHQFGVFDDDDDDSDDLAEPPRQGDKPTAADIRRYALIEILQPGAPMTRAKLFEIASTCKLTSNKRMFDRDVAQLIADREIEPGWLLENNGKPVPCRGNPHYGFYHDPKRRGGFCPAMIEKFWRDYRDQLRTGRRQRRAEDEQRTRDFNKWLQDNPEMARLFEQNREKPPQAGDRFEPWRTPWLGKQPGTTFPRGGRKEHRKYRKSKKQRKSLKGQRKKP
jgi:Sigma-70 region 2